MVMRKLKLLKSGVLAGLLLAVILAGGKKTDPPTVNFIADVDGHEVTFTVEVTDVEMYEWNYGDFLFNFSDFRRNSLTSCLRKKQQNEKVYPNSSK